MTEIVLVRRRDAKTDPPDHHNPVLVGYDEHRYSSRPDTDFLSYWKERWGRWTDIGFRPVAASQPSWWLDIPQDVEGKSLTIDDIRCVLSDALHGATSDAPEIDLLRAALDALDTRNGDNGGQSN